MEEGSKLRTFVSRGQVRYCCPECPYDSYAELEVLRHWKRVHAAGTQSAPAGPILFDADDKPIAPEGQEIVVPPELERVISSLGGKK